MRAWAFEHGTVWAMDLAEASPAPVLPRVAARFEEAHADAVEALAQAMGSSNSESIRRRLATGRRCFTMRVGESIVAYGWTSQASECIGELEREIQIGPGEAYVWDCATLPAHRRLRLYSALLSQIVVQLRGEGVRRIWIGTSVYNQPSLRAFANAGFEPVAEALYMRVLNLGGLRVTGQRGAPAPSVSAARRALTADHERRWGSMLIGIARSLPLPACAQLEG